MKICEVHFKADCPICNPNIAPVPPEMREVAPAPPAPVAAGSQPAVAATLPPPEPEIQDPAAKKVFDAATKYAGLVKQVAIISDQLKTAEEAVKALRAKLAETKKLAEDSLKTMQEVTK